MKVEIECLTCIIHRGFLEISEATKDPEKQFRATSELLKYLSKEFKPDAVAAILGTMRDRMIKRISGNFDIYASKKNQSNKIALELLPMLESMINLESTIQKRFRKACLAAIVGNIIEFDIPDHNVDFAEISHLIENAEKDLAVDDIEKIFKEIEKAEIVLYLTDNAGEIVFDKLLISELKRLSAKVIVVVKSAPILNDATQEDAKVASIFEVADSVITTGTDAVGLPLPEERSKELLEAYDEADFVIAKGMGYAETLTETKFEQPHAFLLRTKCNPVANYFGVSRNRNVAKLIRP